MNSEEKIQTVSSQEAVDENDNTCFVCSEKYNKKRKPIVCTMCNYSCCIHCTKQYLLDKEKEIDTMHCMSCKKAWNEKIYLSHFAANFKSTWRAHRIEIGMNKEDRMLETYSHSYSILKKKKELEKSMKEMIKSTNEEKKRLRALLKDMDTKKNLYIAQITHEIEQLSIDKKIEAGEKCDIDGCTGYSHPQNAEDRWRVCIECNQRKCMDCYEKYTDEHQCSKEMLETVKMVEDNTRKCPGCNIRISKITGCDQMWCVRCRTTFSWKTGQIVHTRQIHNPHYVEFMRNNQNLERDIHDIPCGGIPSIEYQDLLARVKLPSLIHSELNRIQLSAQYIQHQIIIRMHHTLQVDHKANLAMDLLNETITKDQWKVKIYNLDAKMKTVQAMIHVVKSLLIVIIDHMNSIILTGRHHHFQLRSEMDVQVEVYKAFISELNEYRLYFNEVSESIHRENSQRRFLCLGPDWGFTKKPFESAKVEVKESV
jgi:hypothetical protein